MIPLEFVVKTAACQLFVVVLEGCLPLGTTAAALRFRFGSGQLVAPAAAHRVAASTGLSWQEESEVLFF